MRTVGYEQFGICDFCEIDRSGQQTGYKVYDIGAKGICLTCLKRFNELLAIAKAEDSQTPRGK